MRCQAIARECSISTRRGRIFSMDHLDNLPHEEEPDTAEAAENDVQLGPLSNFLGYHLRLAQEASFQAFARRVDATGLRPGYFSVLLLIGLNPGITQTALSRA